MARGWNPLYIFPVMNSMLASMENDRYRFLLKDTVTRGFHEDIPEHLGEDAALAFILNALIHLRSGSHVTVTADGYHYRGALIMISERSEQASGGRDATYAIMGLIQDMYSCNQIPGRSLAFLKNRFKTREGQLRTIHWYHGYSTGFDIPKNSQYIYVEKTIDFCLMVQKCKW